MEEMALSLLKSSPALGLALLIAWLSKQSADKFFSAFEKQIDARLTSQGNEITYLKTKSDTCENDRRHLSQEIIKMKAASGMKFSLVGRERPMFENNEQREVRKSFNEKQNYDNENHQ